MSIRGTGAVAIWHDVAPEGREQFYAWHGQEHMPERVGIPGFRRGRRYGALEADLEFFNLYEAESPQILTGPGYQDRLNNPTPWTLATVTHFRHVARSICRVAATFGHAQGGLAATWRYDVAPEKSAFHIDALSGKILPAIAERGIIAGAHLLVADPEASSVDSAERRARGEANQVADWIVIVEGWGEQRPFEEYCRQALSDDILAAAGAARPANMGLYQLQVTVDGPGLEA